VVSDLIEKYATPQQIEEGFDLNSVTLKPAKMFTDGLEIEQAQEINYLKGFSNENVNQLKNTFETNIESKQRKH
jgi:formylmethanofuran dehydrogenase subunit C